MTETEYKKQIEVMLKDPRSNPENDWHEQWLIDLQDLDYQYQNPHEHRSV
jgi:hypothetical protein